MTFQRPQERYQVQLNVLSMQMNPASVTPDRFILEQPPGTRLEELK
jgi:hypothetical protein